LEQENKIRRRQIDWLGASTKKNIENKRKQNVHPQAYQHTNKKHAKGHQEISSKAIPSTKYHTPNFKNAVSTIRYDIGIKNTLHNA
jgi:hypothetical protein